MVKVERILGLLVSGNAGELSILESRKHIQAGTSALSGGLHSSSTPQRIGQCRKADQRGLRKSSSLTNGTGPVRNKTALGEYAKGGPRSFLLYKSLSMRPSWTIPLMRSVQR
jgi:hypothetical protein